MPGGLSRYRPFALRIAPPHSQSAEEEEVPRDLLDASGSVTQEQLSPASAGTGDAGKSTRHLGAGMASEGGRNGQSMATT